MLINTTTGERGLEKVQSSYVWLSPCSQAYRVQKSPAGLAGLPGPPRVVPTERRSRRCHLAQPVLNTVEPRPHHFRLCHGAQQSSSASGQGCCMRHYSAYFRLLLVVDGHHLQWGHTATPTVSGKDLSIQIRMDAQTAQEPTNGDGILSGCAARAEDRWRRGLDPSYYY